MKSLTETVITYALAIGVLIAAYSMFGAWLTARVAEAFAGISK